MSSHNHQPRRNSSSSDPPKYSVHHPNSPGFPSDPNHVFQDDRDRHQSIESDHPTLHLESSFHSSQRILAYLIFLILGSSFLLPWNSLLVSTTYFGSRLVGNRFEFSYMNWLTVTYTLTNVIFLYHATFSRPKINHTIPTFLSLSLTTSLCIILLISTRYPTLDSNVFFGFLMLITFAGAIVAAELQNAVIGLSSWFGPNYLQAILSGQGAIGTLVSVLQLLANVNELNHSSDGPTRPGESAKHIRRSSFVFYTLCTAFCFLALSSFGILLRLSIYRSAVQRKNAFTKLHSPQPIECEDDESVERPLLTPTAELIPEGVPLPIPFPFGSNIRIVERKIRSLGLSIFYNFFITLAVFPSLTGFILSSNDPDHIHIGSLSTTTTQTTRFGFLNNWYHPAIFIPIHFVIFNSGDWLGKVLPQILPRFSQDLVKRKRILHLISIVRTVFIPLFVVCNVDRSSLVLIRSDLVYFIILSLFAVSNGYLSTLIMISGVVDPNLEPDEVDLAATCLAFYLTSGLSAGSLISFAVQAIVLHF